MTNSATGRYPSHPHWDAFCRRHAGCPFLTHDPLYALSEPLIEAIKRTVPGFFTGEEERFERDLARSASFGFFLHRPFGSTHDATEHESGRTLDERHEDSSRQLNRMLAEELLRAGTDQEDVRSYFERGTKHRERVEARQDAYVGWLVMNPEYRDEVRQFRERWGDAVRVVGRFPRLPMEWIPDPTDEAGLPPGFRDECYRFFCRWGLDTLATWDWPVPMEPDLNIGQRRDVDLHSSSGVILFVPWYLLRGEKLDLREVVRRSRLASVPGHLHDWVNKQAGRKGDDLGDIRYATIRWLYRHDELVLVRRYATVCEGNRQRLDRAFANVIGRDEDTVKKLRRELRRALGGTASGQSSA